MEEHFEKAKLKKGLNQWNKIQDFSEYDESLGPGKNFSVKEIVPDKWEIRPGFNSPPRGASLTGTTNTSLIFKH